MMTTAIAIIICTAIFSFSFIVIAVVNAITQIKVAKYEASTYEDGDE